MGFLCLLGLSAPTTKNKVLCHMEFMRDILEKLCKTIADVALLEDEFLKSFDQGIFFGFEVTDRASFDSGFAFEVD